MTVCTHLLCMEHLQTPQALLSLPFFRRLSVSDPDSDVCAHWPWPHHVTYYHLAMFGQTLQQVFSLTITPSNPTTGEDGMLHWFMTALLISSTQ